MSITTLQANDSAILKLAFAEMGVKEVPGKGSNKQIEKYFAATTLGAGTKDDVPWCSAFVNWIMQQTSHDYTRSAMARSWLKWGKPITTPQRGCVVVFWRTSRQSTNGHVALFLGMAGPGRIYVLGGNQNDRVGVSTYKTDQVLGYRIPSNDAEADRPPPVQNASMSGGTMGIGKVLFLSAIMSAGFYIYQHETATRKTRKVLHGT